MDGGLRLRAADRRPARSPHAPRSYSRDERRKLPSDPEQEEAGSLFGLTHRPLARFVGRPPLRLGRPKGRPQAPFQPSTKTATPSPTGLLFAPPKWSKFTPPLTRRRGMLPKGSLLRPPALMTKVYGPLRRTYSFRLPGLAQNQSSRHGPPSGGPDFQRPSNRAPATRVGVSKSLLGRCLCGFEASRTRRASTTSARRDRARPGVVSCSRFSSGATRNGEMRRQIGW